MKNILKGGLGAALILVLIYLVSIHVSSCTSRGLKRPIRFPNDTTVKIGSRPGLQPKAIIIVKCALNNCYGAVIADSAPVPPGTLAVDMVFTMKESIPANSEVRLRVYENQDPAYSSENDKTK
jgi:hypothetical protein